MPIDPRKLKPTELVRLLNSTPLGEVISERQLHRHRSRAGFRIGDGRTVDLLRYVAWLVIERHRPKPEPDGLTGYDAHKERAAQRNREMALLGRDIATGEWVHPPRNAEQRQRSERDFRFFCEAYFPQTFHLPWSPDHLKVIAKIEQAVLEGGLFAMAIPRGSGKTSLCEVACLWALVYGHREFVALIGSDEEHAASMLDSIKVELETNDLLEDDFSEVVGPVRALEGIHQRAAGQIYRGKQTHIGWTAREIVLPTLPPLEWLANHSPKSNGAIIKVAGITGRIRGMKHKRADGSSVRPALVLIDDPQTDESARSPSQCMTRERILSGAILGLAGPGRKIAGLMALTVVRPDDPVRTKRSGLIRATVELRRQPYQLALLREIEMLNAAPVALPALGLSRGKHQVVPGSELLPELAVAFHRLAACLSHPPICAPMPNINLAEWP